MSNNTSLSPVSLQKETISYRQQCFDNLYESLDAFVIGIGEQSSEALTIMHELQRSFMQHADLDGTDADYVSNIMCQSNIISSFLVQAVEHWQHLQNVGLRYNGNDIS